MWSISLLCEEIFPEHMDRIFCGVYQEVYQCLVHSAERVSSLGLPMVLQASTIERGAKTPKRLRVRALFTVRYQVPEGNVQRTLCGLPEFEMAKDIKIPPGH